METITIKAPVTRFRNCSVKNFRFSLTKQNMFLGVKMCQFQYFEVNYYMHP